MDKLGMAEWIAALSDLPAAAYDAAMDRFSRESTDFPTPAAVRRMILLSDEQRASHAWDVVAAAIRDQGAYRSVDFSDRIINAVIRAGGGWERLCESDRSWIGAIRKKFIESYLTVAKTGLGDGSPLPGIAERENGFAREKPLAIECGLTSHAIEKRLPYQAAPDAKRIAGPAVRKLSEAFADRMQAVAREKSEREAAELAETEARIKASTASKASQVEQLRAFEQKQRDEWIERVKAKRERKRKAVKA